MACGAACPVPCGIRPGFRGSLHASKSTAQVGGVTKLSATGLQPTHHSPITRPDISINAISRAARTGRRCQAPKGREPLSLPHCEYAHIQTYSKKCLKSTYSVFIFVFVTYSHCRITARLATSFHRNMSKSSFSREDAAHLRSARSRQGEVGRTGTSELGCDAVTSGTHSACEKSACGGLSHLLCP